MTSRERVEAALSHREPDRTPIFEYVLLSPVADQLLSRLYADDPSHIEDMVRELGWEAAVRQAAIDRVDLACLLGHDMCYVTPNSPPSAFTTPPKPAQPAPSTDDPVQRVRLRTEAADASFAPPPDDSFFIYVAVQEEFRRRGMDLPILAPAFGHGVWTDVDLMQTMALAPDVARQHFALATRRCLASVEKYVALGIDQIGVGGDFAGNRPLISPQAYREFIMPEVRAVTRAVHAGGRYAANASDGNLWSVIDDYLIGCEVDGYLEIDLHAGMDLRRLKAAYGDRITLYGNLDCGNVLSFSTPEQIRRHTIDCLEAGMGNGGHILCVSNAITASVPLQNYTAVVAAYQDFFSLPRLGL